MDNIKPQKYLGYFTLRTGTIICGIVEIFVGGVLWIMLQWIRPQLRLIALLYVSVFTVIGCLGVIAGARRSVVGTWTFTCGILLNIILSGMIGLEFVDAIHFLPQPPVAPTSHADVIPLSAAANITPLSAVVGGNPDTILAKTAKHALDEAEKEERKEAKKEAKKETQENREQEKKELEKKSLEKQEQDKKEKKMTDEGKPEAVKSLLQRRGQKSRVHLPLTAFVNLQAFMDSPPHNAHKAHHASGAPTHQLALVDQFVSLDDVHSAKMGGSDLSQASETLHAQDAAQAQAQKLRKGAPGVYGELSRDSQKLLEAQLKGMKHLVRISFGVSLIILSILRLYDFLCSLTWALNECRSFDALKDAPDQYEPLIVAPDEKIGAYDLDLDDE